MKSDGCIFSQIKQRYKVDFLLGYFSFIEFVCFDWLGLFGLAKVSPNP